MLRSPEIARQLNSARSELEEDQIWAMMAKYDGTMPPMICRRAGTLELLGIGESGTELGEKVVMLVKVTDLTFSDLRAARAHRRIYLENLHGGEAITIGEAAQRALRQIGRPDLAEQVTERKEEPMKERDRIMLLLLAIVAALFGLIVYEHIRINELERTTIRTMES